MAVRRNLGLILAVLAMVIGASVVWLGRDANRGAESSVIAAGGPTTVAPATVAPATTGPVAAGPTSTQWSEPAGSDSESGTTEPAALGPFVTDLAKLPAIDPAQAKAEAAVLAGARAVADVRPPTTLRVVPRPVAPPQSVAAPGPTATAGTASTLSPIATLPPVGPTETPGPTSSSPATSIPDPITTFPTTAIATTVPTSVAVTSTTVPTATSVVVAVPGAPFDRVGTWLDVFDFNPAHTNGRPPVAPADVDRMAAAGVGTIYIQAARPEDPKAPGDLVSPDLLAEFTARAHALGVAVVAWYLPHFSNLDDDMRHLSAMLAFRAGGRPFDAIGLDIEWRAAVPDNAARSARLVELSRRLRAAAGGRPLGAIVLPPVLVNVVNPAYWPGFPWAGIKPFYDYWLPMSYWTNRTVASGYRDAHRNTMEDVRRLREHVGNVPIHMIGGIGNTSTPADYRGFATALDELGIPGRSIYDWATGGPASVTGIR